MTHEEYIHIITAWQKDQFECDSDKLNYWIKYKNIIEGELPNFTQLNNIDDKFQKNKSQACSIQHLTGTRVVRIIGRTGKT